MSHRERIRERVMDFRSISKFNAYVNALSGNFLPLEREDSGLGFAATTYMIFAWFVKLIYSAATTYGLVYHESVVVALNTSATTMLVVTEMLIVSLYLNLRRDYLRTLIGKFNGIIDDSHDMRQRILETVDPPMNRLRIYTIAAVTSVALWAGMPIARVFETDRFTYTDFNIPTYFPGIPFTVNVFVVAVVADGIGAVYVIFTKNSLDVYVTYFVALLTAEYRYVREQMTNALRQENPDGDEKVVLRSLQKCIKHHIVVIEIGQMLTELLSLNVGLTYLSCILRFCLQGFFLFTIPGAYFAKFVFTLFSMGNLIQVYILCWCIQELLESSTSITDDAFHENWHGRGDAVKSIFRTIAVSNQIECRLTAFRIVDLTVPAFSSILNQAYSACLLLLKIN